ncbi:MAG: helix-turn-helix domain-containing protein [Nocardioides sp.]|uniref:helix-turn-helix domain-containing protein n=1 Tax=Nocardioides sp. TaxID=35761 RepID=UPI0039E6D310
MKPISSISPADRDTVGEPGAPSDASPRSLGNEAFDSALSLKELAALLHVSVQTLYDLRSQGRGPVGFRVGRHLRFRRAEVTAWLERLESEDAERHHAEARP